MLNLLYVLLCCHLLTSRMKNTESKFSQGVSLYFVCVNGNALCLLFLVQLSLRVIFGDDCSKVGITENALCSFVHTLHTVTGWDTFIPSHKAHLYFSRPLHHKLWLRILWVFIEMSSSIGMSTRLIVPIQNQLDTWNNDNCDLKYNNRNCLKVDWKVSCRVRIVKLFDRLTWSSWEMVLFCWVCVLELMNNEGHWVSCAKIQRRRHWVVFAIWSCNTGLSVCRN